MVTTQHGTYEQIKNNDIPLVNTSTGDEVRGGVLF